LVKKSHLLGRIGLEADATGKAWQLIRQGHSHEIWRCGAAQISVPRHREINELTAIRIFKNLEGELGSDWWKK
jgi:hypothetical protein